MTGSFKIYAPAFLSSIKNQFINSIGRPMFRFCVIVNPLLNGFLMGMFYREQSDENFTLYAILGSGIMTFWGSMAFSSAADIQRERWYGTMENLFACPAGFSTAILGKIVGNTIWGLLSFFISVTFVQVVFSRTIYIRNMGVFAMGFFLMLLSFIAIAYLIAALFTLSRKSRIFMNMMEHPVFILCGVVFPINLLPPVLRLPSYILSPRWVVEILRHSIVSNSIKGIGTETGILLILTACYCIAGVFAFREIDRKARINASLGVY